jgi:hypothetical protein
MATDKGVKDEDKKKKSEDDDEDKTPSTAVDVVIEGEEPKSKPKKEEEKETPEEEVEVETKPEESEEEREQRLSKSQQRKQRQREAREAQERELANLRRQNAELLGRVSSIESRSFTSDVSRIESGITEAQGQLAEANDIIARATKEQNGEALAQALNARDEARRRYDYLSNYRQNIDAQMRQQQAQPKVDPLVVAQSKQWMSKNPWYDPQGGNEDSQIALGIDNLLVRQGLDPREPKYWEELTSRLKKHLPHRFNGAPRDLEEDEDTGRGSPTRGSGREGSGASGGKSTFHISKDRVDSLKEAGEWERFNTEKDFRNRMIKRYREADEKYGTGAQK